MIIILTIATTTTTALIILKKRMMNALRPKHVAYIRFDTRRSQVTLGSD